MFFKEGGVLLLLKKTHTLFFFSRARDFLLHSFLQTAVRGILAIENSYY